MQKPDPPLRPSLTPGRALFVRASSTQDDDGEAGGGAGGGGEGKDDAPPPAAAAGSSSRPVKTLPRPAYEGDPLALIEVCWYFGSGDVEEARDLIERGINIDEKDGWRRSI